MPIRSVNFNIRHTPHVTILLLREDNEGKLEYSEELFNEDLLDFQKLTEENIENCLT